MTSPAWDLQNTCTSSVLGKRRAAPAQCPRPNYRGFIAACGCGGRTMAALNLQAVFGGELFQLRANWNAAGRFLNRGRKEGLSLAAMQIEQHRLDWADRRRRQR